MYNAARCYEFCAHFPGSQKSPKIQTAQDSSTFRVSHTNTRITAVYQKKNRMTRKQQAIATTLCEELQASNCVYRSRGAPARGIGPPPV